METFFGILLIIFLVIVLFRPWLNRWLGPALQRWAMHRMEDQMRRMAGMPSRKEEKKRRKAARKENGASGRRTAAGGTRMNTTSGRHEPIIPPDYPEDVEFVEIKSYSEETVVTTETSSDGKTTRIKVESQIEDAEFEEIR